MVAQAMPPLAAPAAPALARLLVVDDEEGVRTLLGAVLEREGYDVETAGSVAAGLGAIMASRPELVLVDVSMPDGSGLDLAETICRDRPETAVVMISGNDEPDVARAALAIGTYGFLIKPFGPSALLIAVTNALRRRELELESRAHRDELERAVAWRTRQLTRSREETVRRLAAVTDARDHETGRHIERMGAWCLELALRLGIEPRRAHLIGLAGMLHDVGKIAVPDAVLQKAGPLTEDERAAVERHADIGRAMLSGSGEEVLELAATIAHTHHERLDGSGYPRGLVGDEIPLEGRIAAVADVFDALTSDRVYRPARSTADALEHLRKGAGTLFDPDVVAALGDVCAEASGGGGIRTHGAR